MNPYWRFSLIAALPAVVLTLVLAQIVSPLAAWLLAINLAAVGLYRYDKLVAGTRATRVPERVLLMAAAAGGSVGAGIAMWLLHPRHKTRSASFLFKYLIIVLVQIIAILAFIFRSM